MFEAVFKNTFKQNFYVETGQQAIDAYRDNPEIDLVLMDVKMPVKNGYTAIREIRKFNEEKSIEAGCNEYIAKPINIKLHF